MKREASEARDAIVARIRDDTRRGASELARDAVSALPDFAELLSDDVLPEARRLARELASTRPTLGAIGGLLDHCLRELPSDRPPHAAVRYAAERTLAWAQDASERAVSHAVDALHGAKAILTHSRSSTVERVLSRLAPPARVVVSESHPGLEGHDLARHLAENGAQVDIVTDAELALVVGEVDAVLVGADAILADGSVINKVGTHLLALAAREREIPFYVCAESFKLTGGTSFEPEEHDPNELEAPEIPGIRPLNYYFERTPAKLVSIYLSDVAIEDEVELPPKRR
jgi:translation initiation factor 2B subunit (eIF-2B alpha/beta/delta family)